MYDAALAEYRFNVQLSWDRTKFYLTLSITAVAVGIALFHFAEGSWIISLFCFFVLLMLIFLSVLGLDTVKTGKQYTREAIYTKTLVERELGLLRSLANSPNQRMHFGIAVTPSMLDHKTVIEGHAKRMTKNVGPRSILGRLNRAFFLIIAIEIAGVIAPWIDIIASLKNASISTIDKSTHNGGLPSRNRRTPQAQP